MIFQEIVVRGKINDGKEQESLINFIERATMIANSGKGQVKNIYSIDSDNIVIVKEM